MSFASKTSSLQAYNMLLYEGAVHPEFFPIVRRRRIRHGDYEFEAWVYRGGHVLRFEHNGDCGSELVTEEFENLPIRGLLTALPCAGEKDHEAKFGEDVKYMTSIQTETLSDHLYQSTFNELLEHGKSNEGMIEEWTDESGKPNLSLIDIQRFADQIHIQGYHCRSDCCLVLRTQTIFEVNGKE